MPRLSSFARASLLSLPLLLVTASASAERLVLTIAVPEPRLEVDTHGFTHVHLDGYLNLAQPGEPALPARPELVLLPHGQRIVSITLQLDEPLPLAGRHLVAPAQPPRPISLGAGPYVPPDPLVYASDEALPGAVLSAEGVQRLRGFAFVPIVLRPVSYRPASGALAWHPRLRLVLETAPEPLSADPANRLYRGLPRDFTQAAALALNPEQVTSYPLRALAPLAETRRYVIVTSAALAACAAPNNLQALAADKQARGISTYLETVENIRAAYPAGRDDAERVRLFLRAQYQTYGANFALLAGDADLQVVGGETQAPVVPARGMWADIGYGEDPFVPSDLYFGALDGTFNSDNDDRWGEPGDGIDALAELWVGRAPVDSCAELANFVRKTLAYQAASGAWLQQVQLMGEWLWETQPSFGIDYLQDIRYSSTADGFDTKGFSESSFFTISVLDDKFASGPNCDGQPSPCWDGADALAVLNSGKHIINHLGHSYTNYNMRLMAGDLAAGLTNTLYFFDYSQGCYCGAFDNRYDDALGYEVSWQDSFAEHLLLGQRGAAATVMNTRYGLGGVSNHFHRYFWDAYFRSGITRLGQMQAYSRERLAGLLGYHYYLWIYYVSTLFGDPELELHVSASPATPALNVSPAELVFMGIADQYQPTPVDLSIANSGAGVLDWQLSASATWLTCTPGAGSALAGTPSPVRCTASIAGLAEGRHDASLTITAPGATGAPVTLPVRLYVIQVPAEVAPRSLPAPVLDGAIGASEYSAGRVLDLDPQHPGTTVARVLHDGLSLYLGLSVAATADADVDAWDALLVFFDNDNDNAWPAAAGGEGMHQLFGDGYTAFIPMYNAGDGWQTGTRVDYPSGLRLAYNSAQPRVFEAAWSLASLGRAPGQSLGVFLFWYDFISGDDWEPVAFWPWALDTYDHTGYFGDLTLGTASDGVAASPEALAFSGLAGGATSAARDLVVSSTTTTAQAFTLLASQPWVELSVTSGSTPALVKVSANPGALGPGTHNASITIDPTAGGVPDKVVPVSVVVSVPPPAFAVDPGFLAFEAEQDGALPAGQTLTIANGGAGTLAWTATTEGTWFDLSASAGSISTTPQTITVTPSSTALAAGSFAGAIVLTAPGAAPLRVELTYAIRVPPVLSVSPLAITRSDPLGAGSRQVSLTIANAAPGMLTWTLSESCAWLEPSASAGNAVAGHPVALWLNLDPDGLGAGLHQTTLQVTAPGAQGSPQTVTIAWTLFEGPVLAVTPSALSFTGSAGGTAPAAQSVSIDNSAAGTLAWTAACTPSWLSCTPASGTAPSSLSVAIDPSGLSAGVRSGTVAITSTSTGEVVNLPVTLTLTATPTGQLVIVPASLSFTALVGRSPPASQSLALSEAGAGALGYTVECVEPWLYCVPQSGTTPNTLDVAVDHAGLPAGSHSASIAISAPDAANSPYVVPVTLAVNAGDTRPPDEDPQGGCACAGGGLDASWLLGLALLALLPRRRRQTGR